MAATHRVNLPVARGVTVETSPDGKQTALLFKTSTGPGFVGIALNNAELARMVSLLLSQATKVAARVVPVSPPTKMTSRFRQRPIRLRGDNARRCCPRPGRRLGESRADHPSFGVAAMKSPGIGSRETSAARNDFIITAHDERMHRSEPRLGGSHQRSRAGRSQPATPQGTVRCPLKQFTNLASFCASYNS